MGDYFFMFFIISRMIIRISNSIIYSINNTPFMRCRNSRRRFLVYNVIITEFRKKAIVFLKKIAEERKKC